MKKESQKKLLNYLLSIIQTVFCGSLIGLVIGLYQFVIGKLVDLSKFMYSNGLVLLLIMFVIVVCLAFVSDLILKFCPSIEGSGIPDIELGIRNKKKIDWKKEIVLMFVNSCISTFVGFPLGSEGPSVVIGGKISKMVQDISKLENNEQTAIGCGAGFGCAFLSPLAGLAYVFEEALHKFDVCLFFRSLLMVFSAYFTCSLVNNHHIVVISNLEIPMMNEYYVFLLLMILNSFVGVVFVKLIVGVKKFFAKYKDNKIVSNRGFLFFGIVFLLNVFVLDLMGSGLSIIGNIISYDVIFIVVIVLIFRFFVVVCVGTGKVTGGLVIPIMSLGAIIGQLVYLFCHHLFGLSSDIQSIIVLVSMCMIFGVVTKTPITSIMLVYSVIGYSSGDYLHALIVIPIAALTIFGAVYISKLLKVDCIYEQFMEISLGDENK